MAYQAIVTTYFGPGNVRGARIRAKAQAGTIWIPYEHLGSDKMHAYAAEQFARRFGWRGHWFGGSLNGNSNVYVNAPFQAGEDSGPCEDAAFTVVLTIDEMKAAYEANKARR